MFAGECKERLFIRGTFAQGISIGFYLVALFISSIISDFSFSVSVCSLRLRTIKIPQSIMMPNTPAVMATMVVTTAGLTASVVVVGVI